MTRLTTMLTALRTRLNLRVTPATVAVLISVDLALITAVLSLMGFPVLLTGVAYLAYLYVAVRTLKSFGMFPNL